MLLKSLRFRTKLFIGFAIVILFSIVTGILSIVQLNKIHSRTELIYKHPFAVSNAVRDINTCINGMHRSMKDVVLAESQSEMDSALNIVKKLNKQALAAFDVVYNQFLGDSEVVEITYQSFIDWETIRNEVIRLKLDGKNKEAAEITKGKGADHVWNLLDKTKVMSNFAHNKAVEFKAESEKTYQQTLKALLLIIIFVIGLSVFMAFLISKNILTPIHKFIAGIRALYSNGVKSATDIEYATEEDLLSITISELKTAYNQVQEANQDYQALNEELDTKVRERTFKLEKSQFELKEKNEEYLAINEEYELLNEELNQTNKNLVLAKEKAEESKKYLEKVINNIGEPVFVKDEQSRFLQVNEAFCNLFGLSKNDIINKTLAEDITPEERESFLKIDKQVLDDGIENINEETLTVRGGKTRILLTRKTRFIDENNNKFLVGAINDITQIKKQEQELILAKEKAEMSEVQIKEQNEEFMAINEELRQTIEELENARKKAEESDRLKSAFLANMSHEIRTPMNGIIGFAKLLQKHDMSEDKLSKYIDIIVTSSNQLLSIVNDVLDISRIETGQVEMYENNINLNATLEEIKNFFELKVSEKKLEFNLQCEIKNDESNILIDDSKLKQIIFNLIGNALKFTHEGVIEFGYKLKDQNLEFFVKDTGIGIPKKNQKHIFDRFNKVEHGSGGTGLGLAISKGLVERMNGNIWLESVEGEGACFYFTLPFVPTNETKEDFVLKEKDIEVFKSKILIVEDEEINAIYLKEILNKRNIKFIHAWNGEQAVDICSGNEKIDLVLMDIKLPKMDGYEAARKIKNVKPKLPIIAQTAYAMESDKVDALNAGCDDYISKPVLEEKLIRLFEKYLKKEL